MNFHFVTPLNATAAQATEGWPPNLGSYCFKCKQCVTGSGLNKIIFGYGTKLSVESSEYARRKHV